MVYLFSVGGDQCAPIPKLFLKMFLKYGIFIQCAPIPKLFLKMFLKYGNFFSVCSNTQTVKIFFFDLDLCVVFSSVDVFEFVFCMYIHSVWDNTNALFLRLINTRKAEKFQLPNNLIP